LRSEIAKSGVFLIPEVPPLLSRGQNLEVEFKL